jgi:type IV secretory pathway VirB2 component (pilin)
MGNRFHQGAVDLLGDSSVAAVDQVVDGEVARQRDLEQVAVFVVVVGGRGAAFGLGLEFSVLGVVVGCASCVGAWC